MKHLIAVMMAVVTTYAGVALADHPTECGAASFKPEVHTFYGDSKAILAKLADFQAGLDQRRMYMLSVDSAKQSDFRIFERNAENEGMMDVYSWQGGSTDELKQQIAANMLKNRGMTCIGEQTKSLVNKSLKLDKPNSIQDPHVPLKAFASTIDKYSDSYIRVTVYLMC